MASRNGNFWTDGGDYVEMTAGDATTITFQNQGERRVRVKGTTTATKPAANDFDGTLVYEPGEGEENRPLTEMFLGLSGVKRLWIWCTVDQLFFASHA